VAGFVIHSGLIVTLHCVRKFCDSGSQSRRLVGAGERRWSPLLYEYGIGIAEAELLF
jgi:hypothetical protein